MGRSAYRADVSEVAVDEVDPGVRARVEARVGEARRHLDTTVDRRREVYDRLKLSLDPDEQAVARVYRDYLVQAEEIRTSGASLTVAAAPDGRLVVGRLGIFDDGRDVVLVSWHSPEGQRQLLSDDRLMVVERDDGSLALSTLRADDRELAARVRDQMRRSAAVERMSDPLATLTLEQGEVLRRIVDAPGHTVLHGPPGSGKSAIVMVELARRVLSADRPERFDALFVTGTERLRTRAEALGRMLGTASISAVTQAQLLSFLGVTERETPQAGAGATTGSLAMPLAVERAYADLRSRLHDDVEVPHPLGVPVRSGELEVVATLRAEDASTSYVDSARRLADGIRREYAAILPGEPSAAAAAEAADRIRPWLTPTDLLARVGGGGLPRELRAAATAAARSLLERKGGRRSPSWDLIVVDEYQRLPGVVTWLLAQQASRLLLSGDPLQSFAAVDASDELAGATAVDLRTSLRVPDVIAAWIDDRWQRRGLAAPRIRTAARGGEVREHPLSALDHGAAGAATIAPASRARRRDGWLDPTEAVGLEWSSVDLVAPDEILAEHGAAGLFIAATRAIDTLDVYG